MANLYKIESEHLFFEYRKLREPGEDVANGFPESQKPPTYQDLSICKIEEYYGSVFSISKRRPQSEEILTLCGYKRVKTENKFKRDGDNIDISGLSQKQATLKVRNRDFGICTIDRKYFHMEPSEVPNVYKYNNLIMLEEIEMTGESEIGAGLSGGPFFDKNKGVVGLFFVGVNDINIHYMLCSKYISKQS